MSMNQPPGTSQTANAIFAWRNNTRRVAASATTY